MNQLGYYGKTPHRGDFVRFNLPQSFVNVWDDWLQQVLIHAEQSQENWSERYQQAPGYRFVLSSGIAGNDVWIGLLQPSQDKVGRRFPFCLAMSLPETALPCVCVTAQTAWFEDAEALMARVLEADYAFDDLQNELAEMAERTEFLDAAVGNPMTALDSRATDNITLNITSENALQHPLVTPAVLDGILSQTIGEYSVWVNRDPSAATTTLASGLPMESAGVALFTGDWQAGSTAQLEVSTLARSVGGALSLFAADLANGNGTDNSPTQPMDKPTPPIDDLLQESAVTSTDAEGSAVDSSAVQAEIPSADDWAALDEFEDGSDSADAFVVPEVEPLELDDDDQPEAPWEK